MVCCNNKKMTEEWLIFRLNVKLEMKGVEPMKDLVKDFSDGVKLIQVSRQCLPANSKLMFQLLVRLSHDSLGMQLKISRKSCRKRAWADTIRGPL